MKTPEDLADEYVDTFTWPYYEVIQMSATVLADTLIAAIKEDRAQREGQEVYVIQGEDGDIIDVTTSREWAEWQTREDGDNPLRTLHEDTIWDGPEDREEWA